MATKAERARSIQNGMVWELFDLAEMGWWFRDDLHETGDDAEHRDGRRARIHTLRGSIMYPDMYSAIPYANR